MDPLAMDSPRGSPRMAGSPRVRGAYAAATSVSSPRSSAMSAQYEHLARKVEQMEGKLERQTRTIHKIEALESNCKRTQRSMEDLVKDFAEDTQSTGDSLRKLTSKIDQEFGELDMKHTLKADAIDKKLKDFMGQVHSQLARMEDRVMERVGKGKDEWQSECRGIYEKIHKEATEVGSRVTNLQAETQSTLRDLREDITDSTGRLQSQCDAADSKYKGQLGELTELISETCGKMQASIDEQNRANDIRVQKEHENTQAQLTDFGHVRRALARLPTRGTAARGGPLHYPEPASPPAPPRPWPPLTRTLQRSRARC